MYQTYALHTQAKKKGSYYHPGIIASSSDGATVEVFHIATGNFE